MIWVGSERDPFLYRLLGMRYTSQLVVLAIAVAACTSSQTVTSTTAVSSIALDEATTSTVAVGDLATSIIDLLDGSELEVVGPAHLELNGYLYEIELPKVRISNVYVSRGDPEQAAASEDAEFHSDLGDGVQLWVGDREGQPLFMSVEMGDWVSFLYVGWETPPETEFLVSLADQLRGAVSSRGVVLPNHDVDAFTTYLGDPNSEDSIHLRIGQCHRDGVLGSDVVEHPNRGEMVRKAGYAS